MITKSCPHCGAPVTGDKCEYCGAVFYDFSAIDISNEKPTYLKLRLPNNAGYMMARAIVESCNMKVSNDDTVCYADNSPFVAVSEPELTVSLEFRVISDDGILYKRKYGETK